MNDSLAFCCAAILVGYTLFSSIKCTLRGTDSAASLKIHGKFTNRTLIVPILIFATLPSFGAHLSEPVFSNLSDKLFYIRIGLLRARSLSEFSSRAGISHFTNQSD